MDNQPPMTASHLPDNRSLLGRLIDTKPGELGPVLWAAAYFFCIMASWFILRPIRDEAGIAGGIRNLPWLFTGTMVAMLVVSPSFAALVAKLPRKRFVPIAYRFFLVNLLVFFALFSAFPEPPQQVWVGRAFYIWASVFNLFVVSVFWGFLAVGFGSEQGKRLFGFIGVGGTVGGYLSVLEQNAAGAKLANCLRVVADEENSPTFAGDVFHLAEAFLLKRSIADGEHFIDEKNFRLEVRRDREREARVHAAAVAFRRRVDELLHLREIHDGIELSRDLLLSHPENRAAQVDVLSSGELGVEPRPDFEQRTDSSVYLGSSACWLSDARKNFEQRALSRPVAPDDSDDLTLLHVERDVVQRPESLHRVGLAERALPEILGKRGNFFLKRAVRLSAEGAGDAIRLGDAFHLDRCVAHTVSAKPRSTRRKKNAPPINSASETIVVIITIEPVIELLPSTAHRVPSMKATAGFRL